MFSDVSLGEWIIVAIALIVAIGAMFGLVRLRKKIKAEAKMYNAVFERVAELERQNAEKAPAPAPETAEKPADTAMPEPNDEGVIVIDASGNDADSASADADKKA